MLCIFVFCIMLYHFYMYQLCGFQIQTDIIIYTYMIDLHLMNSATMYECKI